MTKSSSAASAEAKSAVTPTRSNHLGCNDYAAAPSDNVGYVRLENARAASLRLLLCDSLWAAGDCQLVLGAVQFSTAFCGIIVVIPAAAAGSR